MTIQQAMRTRFDSPEWPAARQAYIDHHSTEPMRFTGPKHWGDVLTVEPLRTVSGRLLIGVETEAGRSFAITVSRWITERRAGRILPL